MALVLAAGGSRRFGRGDKLMATLAGRPVLAHVLDHALAAPVQRVVVVAPSARGPVASLARRRLDGRLRIVVAHDHARGMGTSLAAGLAAVRPAERELLIFLGDMPRARAWPRLRMLAGRDAVRPTRAGMPGHPLLVRTAAAKAAQPGGGDRGLISRLDPARVRDVRAGAGTILDIDTRRALRRARIIWKHKDA